MGPQLAASVPGVSTGFEADDRVLAISDPLRLLLPDGVRRGSIVAVAGSTALALAVTAGVAAATEGWVGGVGWERMGLMATHELGVPWERLVVVAAPEDQKVWALAVSVLVDAFDVVVVQPTVAVGAMTAKRLAARARERGTVMIIVSGPERRRWPMPPDVVLRVLDRSWEGLGHGHGYLRARWVVVEATGRGRLSRPRQARVWLPAIDGALAVDAMTDISDIAAIADEIRGGVA
jgi:Zn-dependent alcohol dehydrogenase